MAVTRARNSGIKTGVLKYDSMLGGYPPLMAAPTATAGVESASVAFTAVSGISTYRVISTPGSLTGTGSASPISVTGLTAGTGYTFQVRGENTVGNGAYSAASNSVTPTVATAYDSIATQTVSSATASITFSSIPSTYKHLQVRMICKDVYTAGSAVFTAKLTLNGATTNYNRHAIIADGSVVSGETNGGDATQINFIVSSTSYPTDDDNIFGAGIIDIHDYASTSKNKVVRIISGSQGVTGTTSNSKISLTSGIWVSTNAVTSLTITRAVSNIAVGSTFALYGIKG